MLEQQHVQQSKQHIRFSTVLFCALSSILLIVFCNFWISVKIDFPGRRFHFLLFVYNVNTSGIFVILERCKSMKNSEIIIFSVFVRYCQMCTIMEQNYHLVNRSFRIMHEQSALNMCIVLIFMLIIHISILRVCL